MKKINIIGASTLAALEGNLVMTLLPNVLRRVVRRRSSAVGIACLMITTAAGAGETWDTFASGAGVNGPVRAVTTFDGNLIVGGQFGTAGGVPGTFVIAGWDGTGWFSLGDPVTGVGLNNSVLALTTFGTDLIAGGLFTLANGMPASHIAKWNGTTWSPLGAGLNGEVYALAVFNNELYGGGAFTKAGGTTVNYIAKWNGSAWSKLGTGVDGNSIVFALTSFNGGLIVGGQFAMAGGVAGTPGIARWSGSTWSALGSGLNNTVMSLATFDDLSGSGTELYVGGYFTAPVGGAANSAVQIARWNGAWSAVGSGMVVTQPGDSMPRAVFALSPNPSGDLLYAGGFCEVSPHTVGVAGYLMGYHFVP